MEAKVNHLQRCLNGIYKVISGANNILCGISQPSVCSEVVRSPQGVAYISGVIEVYKVAKRVEGGMKDLNINSENLQNCLRDIELMWNNLQAFFSFSPSVLHMLGKVDSVLYNSCYYHASCANFWLNCVDSNLPGLIAVERRSQALEQASLAVPALNSKQELYRL
ncbi:synergin gamma-like isoform X2 [Mobula hypostoma]|uniref:synergin gamma-like isoform X2 n=1 Tax=Mobula hypostoma TaxID=723540 RepID=UPI002FC38F69